MIKLTIIGMTCASCSARVEKALRTVDGVEKVSVNLLTNSAIIEGAVKRESLVDAVRRSGYDVQQSTVESDPAKGRLNSLETRANIDEPFFSKELLVSLLLFIAVSYLTIGITKFNLPFPAFFANRISIGVLQLILSGTAIFINRRFFISGFSSCIKKAPNMDALVSLGAGISFLFSVVVLFDVINSFVYQGTIENTVIGYDYYFESSVGILFFISLGKSLEKRAKRKTTSALKALTDLVPDRAFLLREGKEVEVSVSEIHIDDVFLVKPGLRIPVDGVVTAGESSVDESMLTGEWKPIDKHVDSAVFAGTLNTYGFIRCRAIRIGENTTLGQIIRLTINATATKAPVARLADKAASFFVPFVVLIAFLTFGTWIVLDKPWTFALIRSITVLTISCPCALGLATPASIMVGMGVGARRGILFKTAEALENLSKVKTFVFDKTGTLTTGRPIITDYRVVSDISENEFWNVAYSLEIQSEHPLAKAIIQYISDNAVKLAEKSLTDFKIFPGKGVYGKLEGKAVVGGKFDFICDLIDVPKNIVELIRQWENEGKTIVCFADSSHMLGFVGIADAIKAEAYGAVFELLNSRANVMMLTGDSLGVANAVAKEVNISEIVADVLPIEKETKIIELAQKGKVAFIGDGINDALALTRADIGVSLGSGTDVAIDAADVVLTSNNLNDVYIAWRLSRTTLKNIYENLFWALGYNVVGIPLAAGFLTPLLGWTFSPTFGSLAMSLSSLCVVFNSLRINWINIQGQYVAHTSEDSVGNIEKDSVNFTVCDVRDIVLQNNSQRRLEENIVILKMNISGMMCGHCEERVKKTLETLSCVESAQVDHTKGTAIVEISNTTENVKDVLSQAVVAQGYDVLSVE